MSIVDRLLASGFPLDLRSSMTGYHHSSTRDKWERRQNNSRKPPKREYTDLAPLGTNAIWNAVHTENLEPRDLLIVRGARLREQLKKRQEAISLGGGYRITRIEYSTDPLLAACHDCVAQYYQLKLQSPSAATESELQGLSFSST